MVLEHLGPIATFLKLAKEALIWLFKRPPKEIVPSLLEIPGIGPMTEGHHRILVHNLSGKRIRFKARLHKAKPALNYPLPVDLQPTHCKRRDNIGEIAPNDDWPVDVFVDTVEWPAQPFPGTPAALQAWAESVRGHLLLKLMGSTLHLYAIPRDARQELLIGVYPVGEPGQIKKRWFYIVPQQDGSVILTPG
jgi:hypothetical protein